MRPLGLGQQSAEALENIIGLALGAAHQLAQALDGAIHVAGQMVEGHRRNALQHHCCQSAAGAVAPLRRRADTNLSLSKVSADTLGTVSAGRRGHIIIQSQGDLHGIGSGFALFWRSSRPSMRMAETVAGVGPGVFHPGTDADAGDVGKLSLHRTRRAS